jgi:hypothetical protein
VCDCSPPALATDIDRVLSLKYQSSAAQQVSIANASDICPSACAMSLAPFPSHAAEAFNGSLSSVASRKPALGRYVRSLTDPAAEARVETRIFPRGPLPEAVSRDDSDEKQPVVKRKTISKSKASRKAKPKAMAQAKAKQSGSRKRKAPALEPEAVDDNDDDDDVVTPAAPANDRPRRSPRKTRQTASIVVSDDEDARDDDDEDFEAGGEDKDTLDVAEFDNDHDDGD